jgi:hypothetical protein
MHRLAEIPAVAEELTAGIPGTQAMVDPFPDEPALAARILLE